MANTFRRHSTPAPASESIAQKVLTNSFCKSQFPHICFNVFFTLVIMKDESMDLYGNWISSTAHYSTPHLNALLSRTFRLSQLPLKARVLSQSGGMVPPSLKGKLTDDLR